LREAKTVLDGISQTVFYATDLPSPELSSFPEQSRYFALLLSQISDDSVI